MPRSVRVYLRDYFERDVPVCQVVWKLMSFARRITRFHYRAGGPRLIFNVKLGGVLCNLHLHFPLSRLVSFVRKVITHLWIFNVQADCIFISSIFIIRLLYKI